MGCLRDHSGNQLKYTKYRGVRKAPNSHIGVFSYLLCKWNPLISRTHVRMYARQHVEQRAFKKDRRLSTPEQCGNELRTRSSLKTRHDFHKKYCTALRKYRFCKPTFLDEFPEFERRVIESLRQPLEEGFVNVSRAKGSVTFPARFIMICAMNPCPCGNHGSKKKDCVCPQGALIRYQRKISGPIVDRVDLWVEVPQVDHQKLSDEKIVSEPSENIRKRVIKAREIQKKRFAAENKTKKSKRKGEFEAGVMTNSEMGVKELKKFAVLSEQVKDILNSAAGKLDLSARAYHRVIKLSRTIADLDGAEKIEANHILEALQYRPK